MAAMCLWKNDIDIALDNVCTRNGYLEALLTAISPHMDAFKHWTCRPGEMDCPPGSACVNDGNNGGTCCTGKPDFSKPGLCPMNDGIMCAGQECTSDAECAGDEKCCKGCGLRCVKPVQVTRCDKECPKGETCLMKTPDCQPGMVCIQAFVPTCVPIACEACRPHQECRKVKRQGPCYDGPEICDKPRIFCAMGSQDECTEDAHCGQGQQCHKLQVCASAIQAPIPIHEVVQSRKKRAVYSDLSDPFCASRNRCGPDSCGGCPKGKICKRTDIVCVKHPCDNHECVDDNECGGCLNGQVCEVFYPPCPPPVDCEALRREDPEAYCPESKCEPIATCVFPITCANVRCGTGTTCEMVKPPCHYGQSCEPARPECVSACSKECRQGFQCESLQPPCPLPAVCLESESQDCVSPTCPSLERCADVRPNSCNDLQCPGGTECKMITDTCGRGKLCRKMAKAECVPVCNKKCGRRRECKLTSKCPSDGSECKHRKKCVRKQGCPKCKPGRECALRKRCRKCRKRHVCVLSNATCPRVPKRKPNKRACKREKRRSRPCATDSQCRKKQKCCMSKCGRKICRRARKPIAFP
ncbi:keratin-associated protein 10-6 isoform X2 [Aplysia californica]|nr:keratin-associated protein 10-6 isoform X2 [Aplysia californica]